METRRFAIGDQVRLLSDTYGNDSPADVYTISRALPAMANVWQYRVKRTGDGQERAVTEQQLAKANSRSLTNLSAADAQLDTQRIRNARASARTRVTQRRSEQEKL
jgi:hypothetical protein